MSELWPGVFRCDLECGEQKQLVLVEQLTYAAIETTCNSLRMSTGQVVPSARLQGLQLRFLLKHVFDVLSSSSRGDFQDLLMHRPTRFLFVGLLVAQFFSSVWISFFRISC